MRKPINDICKQQGTDQPGHPRSLISTFVVCCLDSKESRQFIDKTTHRHGFWRQFIDTIEDNSSTLFEDNSSTHLFEGNWQS